ncbi:MAG: FumA C-terminus/TtdB family hydratase beta subunit [Candidatus Omnitrophota bacterium]
MIRKLNEPFTKDKIENLNTGDDIFLTGLLYTSRDQAHKRIVDFYYKARKPPFNVRGKILYYCGPAATPKGKPVGSCGPTTSSRMDPFVEPLLKKGLLGMIGKGRRSKQVRELMRKYHAVYFIAPAGCGALLAGKVTSKKLVCFKDLGPEAVYELKVEDFPLIVAIDSKGKSILDDL